MSFVVSYNNIALGSCLLLAYLNINHENIMYVIKGKGNLVINTSLLLSCMQFLCTVLVLSKLKK